MWTCMAINIIGEGHFGVTSLAGGDQGEGLFQRSTSHPREICLSLSLHMFRGWIKVDLYRWAFNDGMLRNEKKKKTKKICVCHSLLRTTKPLQKSSETKYHVRNILMDTASIATGSYLLPSRNMNCSCSEMPHESTNAINKICFSTVLLCSLHSV